MLLQLATCKTSIGTLWLLGGYPKQYDPNSRRVFVFETLSCSTCWAKDPRRDPVEFEISLDGMPACNRCWTGEG